MTNTLSVLFHLHGIVVYAVVAALVFAEAALFFGFVFPGETAVVLGGALASQGRIDLPVLMVIVVACAIAGDSTGYEVGRQLGGRLLRTKPLYDRRHRVERAERLLRERGGPAVFLGRFIAFFRAVMPALAGASRMRYPTFLTYNAAGGVVWGVGYAMLGYLAGTAYRSVERTAGGVVAGVVAGLVVAGLVVWAVRRHRRAG